MNRHADQTQLQDELGRRVARRLDASTGELSHEVLERLRAARVRALADRRRELQTAPVVVAAGGSAALGGGWWTRLAAVVPLVALAAGLVAINVLQDDQRAADLAKVDSALLTDELPPAAYTDPGFAQFLKADPAPAR